MLKKFSTKCHLLYWTFSHSLMHVQAIEPFCLGEYASCDSVVIHQYKEDISIFRHGTSSENSKMFLFSSRCLSHRVFLHKAVTQGFEEPMSEPKILEITKGIYRGLFKRRSCKEYVRRKVNNVSGFKLCRHFAFTRTPSLSHRVIT